jgi:6-phospho-beta-glucosidase
MQYLFPKDFWWGSASSAPQTEGESLGAGKSPSVWYHWFELQP